MLYFYYYFHIDISRLIVWPGELTNFTDVTVGDECCNKGRPFQIARKSLNKITVSKSEMKLKEI